MKKNEQPKKVGFFKRVFNFRLWTDLDRIQSFFQFIVNTIRLLFIPRPQKVTESFEEVKLRLGLTDEEIADRKKGLFRLSIWMVCLAALLFLYSLYQAMYGSVMGFFLTLTVMCIALATAFRYHFWYFQIQEGRLGCSVREWVKHGLLGVAR